MEPRYFDRGRSRWPVLLFLVAMALSAPAAEDDPSLLQQQANARIDAFVDHFRKTGDFQSRAADLQQAESELTISNQTFSAHGDWSAVAHGLVRLGQIQRMRTHWESALTHTKPY